MAISRALLFAFVVALPAVSCGTKRGSFERYMLPHSPSDFANRIHRIAHDGTFRIRCSPDDLCLSGYPNEYSVAIELDSTVQDSAYFSFVILSTESPNQSELGLLTGLLPGGEIMKQSGSMSRSEKRAIRKQFEQSLLPLLEEPSF